MRPLFIILLMFISPYALSVTADDLMMQLAWKHRVLLVFSPNNDNGYALIQNNNLANVEDGLDERDMLVLKMAPGEHITINQVKYLAASAGFYKRYQVNEDQFRVILVGKDGSIKLEHNQPLTSEEIFTLIDAMPLRRFEMQ